MKVTLLQTDIAWCETRSNLGNIERMMQDGNTDLWVLPEMFATGFVTLPHEWAETDNSTLRWMQHMARQTGAAIAGSVATAVGSTFRNRMYFVRPDDSEPIYYDKRHLFSYGGEHEHYTAGNQRVVAEWKGVRFLLQVCYDLRFPVWSRNHNDYDAALYVASWPSSRRAVWDTLLRARAIENQCYVFGVNRTGSDPVSVYNGGTMAIDAYGRVLAQCDDSKQSSISIEVDMPRLLSFRQKFPVLKDRDGSRE